MTDSELIDYTLKFDTDPVRVRLAKIMDNMPGFILQRLEDVGMDPENCLFENTYDPGDWINHLESELEIYQDENIQLRKELEEQKARTIADLIQELNQEIRTQDYQIVQAREDKKAAEQERDHAKSKLKMWTTLNAQPKELM